MKDRGLALTCAAGGDSCVWEEEGCGPGSSETGRQPCNAGKFVGIRSDLSRNGPFSQAGRPPGRSGGEAWRYV